MIGRTSKESKTMTKTQQHIGEVRMLIDEAPTKKKTHMQTSAATPSGTGDMSVQGGKRLVFDLEGNGLWDADTIWCIATKDLDTGEEKFYGPENVREGATALVNADTLVGHNIIEYDIPLLERLLSLSFSKVSVWDTLVVSRLLNPDRLSPPGLKSSPHSLKTWGYRLGRGKPEHDDWTRFSIEMKNRCVEDVRINELVYYALQEEMAGHDWSQAIEIELKVAEIMARQARNGVYFDVEAAKRGVEDLEKKIEEIDNELFPLLPVTVEQWGVEVKRPFLKNGQPSKMVRDWYADSLENVQIGGPFSRIQYREFNLNSDKQVKQFLLDSGWRPISWNYTPDGERSSPKLEFSEDGDDGIQEGVGALIKKRKLWSHRKSQIEGWIRNVKEDNTLPAGANPCGTNTGRMRHRLVVNVPKAKKHVPYGYEMRSYFTHRPNRVLVGYDAAGLELRMLAHYMNDPEFSDKVINGKEEDGTDIHTYNQKLAGLPTRDAAKTFIYAFNYGAGDGKLGSIAGEDSRGGAELRKRFLQSCPAIDSLIKGVKRASGRGYLIGLDGRRVQMRRGTDGRIQRNKALNTLLQSGGAVVMKYAMVWLDEQVKQHNLDAIKVIDMHDEAQWDVAPEDVETFKELAEQSVVIAGEHFKLNVPLAATAKVGHNWAETH